MKKLLIISLIILPLISGCVLDNKLENKKEEAKGIKDEVFNIADKYFQDNLYMGKLYDDQGNLKENADIFIEAYIETIISKNVPIGSWKFTNEEYDLITTDYADYPFLAKHTFYFDTINKDDNKYIMCAKLYIFDLDRLWFPISEHCWLAENDKIVADHEESFLDEDNDWVEIFKD